MMLAPLRSTRARAIISSPLLAAILGVLPACGHQPKPGAGPQSAPAIGTTKKDKTKSSSTKDYKLVGIVKGVNQEAKEVRIQHEEIPGFMPAMTMPFNIKDPQLLAKLQSGDKVEGTLHVEEVDGLVNDYELKELTILPPPAESAGAPQQELVVSFAGGSPTLKVKPKTLEVGETVPDFEMTGQDGKPFKLSDLRGKVVALTFVYTRCPLPDFCPLMDRKFSELAQKITLSPKRASHIRLISLSFDPEHDTPEVLRKHATIRGATPPLWSYAVASHPELATIAPKLGLVYGPGRDEIMHNLCTAVIDPEGKLARLEVGTSRNKWDASELLKTIYSLVPLSQN